MCPGKSSKWPWGYRELLKEVGPVEQSVLDSELVAQCSQGFQLKGLFGPRTKVSATTWMACLFGVLVNVIGRVWG